MTRLPDEFVDVIRDDRFCTTCGGNLRSAHVLRESHYDMLIASCPKCGHIAQVQETRALSRAGQRWSGLAVGIALILFAGLWAGSSAALSGITIGVIDESEWALEAFIRAKYEAYRPEDADGAYEAGVTVIPPRGPGQRVKVIVNERDEALLNRFGRWWAAQDGSAVLSEAGGWRAAVPWRDFWPWLLLGFIPLCFGFAWSLMLLNVPRRKMILAWPAASAGYLLGIGVFFIAVCMRPAESPGAAAMATLAPSLLPLLTAYFGGLLFIGMLLGRSVMRGIARLALSPRACSALARLWLIDGKPAPRVSAK